MTTPPPPTSASSGTQEERLMAMLSSSEESKSGDDSAGSGFSVASYLNLALENSMDNDQDLQQKMAQLALQLQLQTQSCHEDIGRIGAELQAILPRCHADVGRISLGLTGLQQDASTLLENTGHKTQSNVSSSLETLSTLHALQANLKRTHEILTAAATWDSTLAEIPPLLAPAQQQQDGDDKSSATPGMASNLPQAVQKLALLEKGEKALRGMPNPEERTAALVKLRQQISNLLQPQLQHALQHMSSRLGPLQQCVSLYSQLDMLDTLLQEYVSTRPASLHKAWFDYSTTAAASAAATTKEKETAFAEWIPTWFESVLQLLQDERRQASSVFGPAQVPTILALVLQETFRPILPSFQSRLAVSHGNLELICDLYKSTLQFLSLAYETVAACWLDWMENTGAAALADASSDSTPASARPLDGVSMYKKIVSIYKQITSPFAKYQTSLSQLEQTRAQLDYNTPFSSSVQDVVPSGQIELDDLTKATDRLLVVAEQDIVKTAEAALGRFEFLQGGYHAITTQDSMDQELARRVQLLVTSLQKIVNAMDWAAAFDEPHVLAALQVLKIAATCKTHVGQLQEQMRQRFLLLRERMGAVSAREKEVAEGRSFLIPDALSPVEINALLCFEIFQKDDDSAPAVLTRLGGGGSGVGSTTAAGSATGAVLLGQTQTAVSQLAATCHKFVFQACSSVPQKNLKDMAAMSSWKEPASSASADSYGTLPQPYITQVGEHMLALVQALEPFASDKKSLALANEVMSDIRQVAEQPWRDFISTCGQKDTHNLIIQKLMKADGEILDYVVNGDEHVMDDEDDEDDDGMEDKEVAAFCNAWLDVVGLAVTGRLLERIMSIPTLTEKGCEHLNADLSYLQNVLVALGVSGHPHPLLGHVAELVTLDSHMLSERINTMDKTNQLQATLVGMEQRLAAMKSVGG